MRMPTLVVFRLGLLLVAKLSRLLAVDARNVTVDSTSPLVVYSPVPCYLGNSSGCSTEWLPSLSSDASNSSIVFTSDTNPTLGLTVVPRASLTFQGSSVLFIPGQTSTANATVVVDNLTSILIDTSLYAFLGIGLDPLSNHTITITFVPEGRSTTLEIDHFVIEEPDQIVNITSSATSTLAPTLLPTISTSALTIASSSTSIATPLPNNNNTTSTTHTPPGTVAALSLSALFISLFALLTWLFAIRRRRRRTALQREKAILYDLRLPSERGGGAGKNSEHGTGVAKEPGDLERQVQPPPERPGHLQGNPATSWQEPHPTSPTTTEDAQQTHAQRQEKGKARERSWTWRESILPPVHYTRWR